MALLLPDPEVLQVFAVEDALKFGFLIKEIFALAHLQEAIEILDLELEYVNHVLPWQNQAIAFSRGTLQDINQENSGVVLCSFSTNDYDLCHCIRRAAL